MNIQHHIYKIEDQLVHALALLCCTSGGETWGETWGRRRARARNWCVLAGTWKMTINDLDCSGEIDISTLSDI